MYAISYYYYFFFITTVLLYRLHAVFTTFTERCAVTMKLFTLISCLHVRERYYEIMYFEVRSFI